MTAKRIPDPPGPGAGPSRGGAQDRPKDPALDGAKGEIPPAAAASAKPGADKPVSSPSEEKRRGGFGSIAAAGLIGGVIGAGLLFAVGKTGLGGGADGGRLTALDQRLTAQISALDQRVAGLAPRDALAGLDKRVAGAEATARQALDKSGSAAPPGVAAAPAAGQSPTQGPGTAVPADLMARLESLDQRVSALQEEPGRDQPADSKLGVVQGPRQGDEPKQITALDARVKALEAAGGTAAAAGADIPQKLASLQGEVEARSKANAAAEGALGQRVDGLQQALDARTKAATEALDTVVQASRTAVSAGQAQVAEASKAIDRRLQEQSSQIASLEKSVAQRAEASTVQAALRVVLADRVASALASGLPFAEPLASLRRLDPNEDARLAALAPFADTGAPTASQLADAFRPIADKIAAKRRAVRAQNAAATGDLRSKLLSMADGLVQVRKVDAPAPEVASDPEGKVQASLDRGDLSAASAAFAALPPDAQGEAGDFAPRLKARAQAGEAARAVIADAFRALPSQPAAGR